MPMFLFFPLLLIGHKGIELDRKVISVETIKTVGEYEASARLHKEVKAVIKFSVSAAE